MNENTISGDLIGVSLRQLGATSVREIRSMMHIATFDLGDGIEVSYVFNITKGNQYYLQRMRPYALPWGMFADAGQIVRFITSDIEKFRNAVNSSNFKEFVGLAEKTTMLVTQLEAVFLNNNVTPESLRAFDEELDKLLGKADDMREHASPL